MASPLEDQVWTYISEHRPLKLIFLATATIGVLGSAAHTLAPVWDGAVRLGTRAFVSTPSPEVKEKYGCAYNIGALYRELSRYVLLAPKSGRPESLFTNAMVEGMGLCERRFQFDSPLPGIASKAGDGTVSTEELRAFFRAATSNFNQFQVHLASTDPLALALLRLSTELEESRMGLLYSRETEPAAFTAPLHADTMNDIVLRLERLDKEARSRFPYKLPPLDLKKRSAADLLGSIVAAQVRYSAYFRPID
jgi:hypothetical protein